MKTEKNIRKCNQENVLHSYYYDENSGDQNPASWAIARPENTRLRRVLSCSLEDLRRLIERWLQFCFVRIILPAASSSGSIDADSWESPWTDKEDNCLANPGIHFAEDWYHVSAWSFILHIIVNEYARPTIDWLIDWLIGQINYPWKNDRPQSHEHWFHY